LIWGEAGPMDDQFFNQTFWNNFWRKIYFKKKLFLESFFTFFPLSKVFQNKEQTEKFFFFFSLSSLKEILKFPVYTMSRNKWKKQILWCLNIGFFFWKIRWQFWIDFPGIFFLKWFLNFCEIKLGLIGGFTIPKQSPIIDIQNYPKSLFWKSKKFKFWSLLGVDSIPEMANLFIFTFYIIWISLTSESSQFEKLSKILNWDDSKL
jgi:hypothetical protein